MLVSPVNVWRDANRGVSFTELLRRLMASEGSRHIRTLRSPISWTANVRRRDDVDESE